MRNVVRMQQRAASGATLGELIERYMRVRSTSRPLGNSHKYTFGKIMRMGIAGKNAADLDAADILEMAQSLRAEGLAGATVTQYLCFLRGPLEYAKTGFRMAGVSSECIEDAQPLLEQLQLAGKSLPRTRRPSDEEWAKLQTYFLVQDQNPHIRTGSMIDLMDFSRDSLKRQGEICRVLWEDFEDTDKPMLTVRDMKDPKHKKGNHFRFPLLGRAAEIIRRQSMIDERIFPYRAKSVSQRYATAKNELGIIDLRFHDNRREGVCRMLEAGYSAAQTAAVSGHKNWNTMARVYGASTNPEDVHNGPAGSHRARDEVNKMPEVAELVGAES